MRFGHPCGRCVKRQGSRHRDHVTGPGDALDEGLLKRLQEITFAGASDGAEVAIQGVQKLRHPSRLPNLRYQFRDRPHTTRSCVKNVLRYMAEGKDLLEALVSGKESFCKMVRFKRRFQALWKRRQAEDLDEFMNILQNLAYKECHFDHRQGSLLYPSPHPSSEIPALGTPPSVKRLSARVLHDT